MKRQLLFLFFLAIAIAGCKHNHSHDHDHDHYKDKVKAKEVEAKHDNVSHEELDAHEGHDGEIIFTEAQAKAAGLQTEKVVKGAFNDIIKVSGQVMAATMGEQTVAAPASGLITMVRTATIEGSGISSGQVIATISSRNLQDGDPAAKARIDFETALSEYNRSLKLAELKIISQKEMEQVAQRYQTAKTTYEGLSQTMTAQGVSVKAPMGGYVKSVSVKQGDYVSMGQPIMTITQTKRLMLRADMPQNRYRQLKTISTANFQPASDNKTYELKALNGRLLSFGKTAQQSSPYIPVTFEFDNVGDIMAGTYADVYLIGAERQGVISIPKSALTEEQGIFHVYIKVKGEKDAYLKREVTIGQDNGKRIEITHGLHEGDMLVTKGAYQVKLASVQTAIPHGHSH